MVIAVAITDFFRDLRYIEKEERVTDTGGVEEVIIVDKNIRGIIRELNGNEILAAGKLVEGITARLYTSDKSLRFGGIIDGAYRIVHINRIMDLADFYQYELVKVMI